MTITTLEDSSFWEKVCNICGKILACRKSLNWHKKIHGDSQSKKCPLCNVLLRRKFTFIRHMKEKHGEEEQSESIETTILNEFKRFECHKCGKRFRLERYLEYHIEIFHKKRDKFTCTCCKKAYRFQKDLKHHLLRHHMKNEKVYTFDGNKSTFTCSVCAKEFTRKDSLQTHIKFYHTQPEATFSCDVCERKFRKKSSLIRHGKLKHM